VVVDGAAIPIARGGLRRDVELGVGLENRGPAEVIVIGFRRDGHQDRTRRRDEAGFAVAGELDLVSVLVNEAMVKLQSESKLPSAVSPPSAQCLPW